MIQTHRESRHPLEVLVVGFCVFSGSMQVFSNRAPSTIEKIIGPVFQGIWSWSMLIAGILALIGIIAKDEETGCHFELGGMLGLGFGNIVYGSAVLVAAPQITSTYAGPITIGIGIACFVRAWKISKVIWRSIHQADEERLVDEVRQQLTDAVEQEARSIVENRDRGGDSTWDQEE